MDYCCPRPASAMEVLPFKLRPCGLLTGLVVFFTIAISKTRQQDSYYFDPAPIDQDVVEGQPAYLRCDVSNRRYIKFYWSLDMKTVMNTSRRHQEDSNLRILRVSREQDSGSFRCIATNDSTGVSISSTEARLNILYSSPAQEPEKTAKVKSVNVVVGLASEAEVHLKHPKLEAHVAEGVTLSLKCHAEGNPEPTVQWFKNKNRLFVTDKIKFHKNRIKITNITTQDNGVYSCVAENTAGTIESLDNYLLNIEGDGAAKLDTSTFTKTLLVRRGGEAKFDCHYKNSIITEWYFDDKLLTNTTTPGTKTTILDNGSLVLSNVRQKDEGVYRCVGISENGPVQTFISTLHLAHLEDMTINSFEPKIPAKGLKVVPENQKFEIQCLKPDGLPMPVVRWEDPHGQLVPDTGRVRSEQGKLYLTNVQPTDSGNYTCVAQNMAATKNRSLWVVVSVPPEISRPPLSIRVNEGGKGQFDCQMRGTPFPVTTITWEKDNSPIDMTHPRFKVDQSRGTLAITDVHLNDEGNYACNVNTTGHDVITSTNAHLYVRKLLKFRPTPVNTKLELGSTTKVHCKAEGQVTPTIKWLRDNKPEFPEHIQDVAGVLIFSGVQRSDADYFTCVASSTQGSINATIYIDVVVKPRFKVKPQNTTAYEGYSMMLHCVAVGDPQPTIQWDKNSKVNAFDSKRFRVLGNGSLYISEVYMEDMGKYGCTAGNSGGFEREEIYLHVGSAENYSRDKIHSRMSEENYSMMKTIIIAVCSAVAYLAVVIGLTVYCSIRLVKAKNMRKMANDTQPVQTSVMTNHADKAENGIVPNENTELMDKKERDSSILKSDDARSHASGVSSHNSHNSHSSQSGRRRSYDKLNFPRHDLQTLGMLGKGVYGDVFLAKAHGIKDGEHETLVVVKSLLSRDEAHHFEFRREIDMFGKLNHEHLVKLLGVCREMEPQFLITEYAEWGDLKQFLWATRKDNIKRNQKLPPLSTAQKITMCNQVALAMEHLANYRFIHKDLATRNVLLTPGLDLKVSNLSLCRDVYAAEYYPFHQQLIPLRWMAPESVLEDEFSTKSDVWSYGVFCWEVFTLADMPHKRRTDEEVLKGLKNPDFRLDPLVNCPDEMCKLIDKCIVESAKERPSFSEIAVLLGEMTVDSDV